MFLGKKDNSDILISFSRAVSFYTILCLSVTTRSNHSPQNVHALVAMSPGEQYFQDAPPTYKPKCAQQGQVVHSKATKEKRKFPAGLRICNMNKLKGIYFYAKLLKMLTLRVRGMPSSHHTSKVQRGQEMLGGGREKVVSSLLWY